MLEAAILLLCSTMLIPLPQSGVIIPAASPSKSTWSCTCDFCLKEICEMVTGVLKSISLFSNICFSRLFL